MSRSGAIASAKYDASVKQPISGIAQSGSPVNLRVKVTRNRPRSGAVLMKGKF